MDTIIKSILNRLEIDYTEEDLDSILKSKKINFIIEKKKNNTNIDLHIKTNKNINEELDLPLEYIEPLKIEEYNKLKGNKYILESLFSFIELKNNNFNFEINKKKLEDYIIE